MRNIVVFNRDTFVFPGIISTVMGEIKVTQDYFDTQFGLFIPFNAFGLRALGYLKRGPVKTKSFTELSGAAISAGGVLLNNRNIVQSFLIRKEAPDIFDVPLVQDGKWQVFCGDSDIHIPLTEFAETAKDVNTILKFIENNVKNRFMNPVFVDRNKWTKERIAEKLSVVELF